MKKSLFGLGIVALPAVFLVTAALIRLAGSRGLILPLEHEGYRVAPMPSPRGEAPVVSTDQPPAVAVAAPLGPPVVPRARPAAHGFFIAKQEPPGELDQEAIYEEFETTKDAAVRDTDAYLLSELWYKNKLKPGIKDRLADAHYHLVLVQDATGYTPVNFVVRCVQTFPFPDSWVSFSATLYANNQVAWTGESIRSNAMSQNNNPITSRTGGQFRNGDVLRYEIKLEQKVKNEVIWSRTLKTNEIVLRGIPDQDQ